MVAQLSTTGGKRLPVLPLKTAPVRAKYVHIVFLDSVLSFKRSLLLPLEGCLNHCYNWRAVLVLRHLSYSQRPRITEGWIPKPSFLPRPPHWGEVVCRGGSGGAGGARGRLGPGRRSHSCPTQGNCSPPGNTLGTGVGAVDGVHSGVPFPPRPCHALWLSHNKVIYELTFKWPSLGMCQMFTKVPQKKTTIKRKDFTLYVCVLWGILTWLHTSTRYMGHCSMVWS